MKTIVLLNIVQPASEPPAFPVMVSNYDQAVLTAEWGTYGPNGDQPLRYVRLVDCSSDHLRNIRLQTSLNERHPYTHYIDSILSSRAL